MVLEKFESRLERAVEGAFAKVFRSEVRPVEIGRRLVRIMDANRTIGVDGGRLVPNHFVVQLASPDAARMRPMGNALVDELTSVARDHAALVGADFVGPVRIEITENQANGVGVFGIAASMRAPDPVNDPAHLTGPSGERISLDSEIAVIGRVPDCDVVASDPNVSRRHAEIRRDDTGFTVTDLGSTNGTTVNGRPVATSRLEDGDRVGVGSTIFVFRRV